VLEIRESVGAVKKDLLVKPFLKWAGGKRQLLPAIKAHMPEDIDSLRYYEPFVGAGALFFDCQPRRALINDRNDQLMLTYRAIRDDIVGLLAELETHKACNCKEYYYQIRGLDRDRERFAALTGAQKAARLIYLNKTCYNGLYRVNSKALFNVPYGRYKNPKIYDEPVLRAINSYFCSADIEIDITNSDFAAAAESAGSGSFIYFDPPYHSPDNDNFTGYQADGFGEGEQRRLRDVFTGRTDAGAKCMLSNSDTPFIRKLYNDERFSIISVKARRPINSVATGRGEVGEVLIKNWK